jgi:hypothetical protein
MIGSSDKSKTELSEKQMQHKNSLASISQITPNVLNVCQGISEDINDVLYWPHKGVLKKPQNYHRKARGEYLVVVKRKTTTRYGIAKGTINSSSSEHDVRNLYVKHYTILNPMPFP